MASHLAQGIRLQGTAAAAVVEKRLTVEAGTDAVARSIMIKKSDHHAYSDSN